MMYYLNPRIKDVVTLCHVKSPFACTATYGMKMDSVAILKHEGNSHIICGLVWQLLF